MDTRANSAVLNKRASAGAVFLSLAIVVCVALVTAVTFFVVSPPHDAGRPGVLPWSENSLLHEVVGMMSLGGMLKTVYGVEYKESAIHFGSAVAILLLSLRLIFVSTKGSAKKAFNKPWVAAQILLGGWVVLSLASAFWSGDAQLSLGQGVLYAMAILWAISIAWTLEKRHVAYVLGAFVGLATLSSLLTIWFFIERDPSRRPGFPLGNPGVIGAVLMPAILICVNVIFSNIVRRIRGEREFSLVSLIAMVVALVPIAVAFKLAGALSAYVGLVIGLAALVFFQGRRWMKWSVVLGAVGVVVLAVGLRFAMGDQLTASRGESARFRLYVWKYAVQIWDQHSFAGGGAGCYPRYVEKLAIEDKALEPGVFMGNHIGNAHNELFEVLTEIGLVGGVTFVGGHLATLAAAIFALRRRMSGNARCLLVAATAGYIAIFVESMGNVSLRLPGAPVIFYTLIGIIWLMGRTEDETPANVQSAIDNVVSAENQKSRSRVAKTVGVMCLLLAACVGWDAIKNVRGIQSQYAATVAASTGDFEEAIRQIDIAQADLLKPNRQIDVREKAVEYRFRSAQQHYDAMMDSLKTTGGHVDAKTFESVIQSFEQSYDAATALNEKIPSLANMPTLAAACAEKLASLFEAVDPVKYRDESNKWWKRAREMWLIQKRDNPFHVEALLSLTRYPAQTTDLAILLRDALRQTTTLNVTWIASMERVARRPDFGHAVSLLDNAASPVNAETDVDMIVKSFAPEAFRLSAAYLAVRGRYRDAANEMARAVLIYEAKGFHRRFPTLQATALAERAEYEFLANPNLPGVSISLMEDAIDSLPDQVAFGELSMLKQRLARYLLADGREKEAVGVLAEIGKNTQIHVARVYLDLAEVNVRLPVKTRPPVAQWLVRATELNPGLIDAWSWRAWLAAEAGDASKVNTVLDQAYKKGIPKHILNNIYVGLAERFPFLRSASDHGKKPMRK